jgi:hypothetical protein
MRKPRIPQPSILNTQPVPGACVHEWEAVLPQELLEQQSAVAVVLRAVVLQSYVKTALI